MELDICVPFPGGTPGTGDTVLYSTRAFVSTSSGRPVGIGPIQSGERNMKYLIGWLEADQACTVKLQAWDVASGTWNTINNGGSGDSVLANKAFDINYELPAGDVQLVVNFGTGPGTWKHSKKFRLSRAN